MPVSDRDRRRDPAVNNNLNVKKIRAFVLQVLYAFIM